MAWLKIDNKYINLEHTMKITYVKQDDSINFRFDLQVFASFVDSKHYEINEKQADDLIHFLASTYDLKDVYDLDELVERMKEHDKKKAEP